VDLAGTGDTAGSAAELCGAMYHSAVLQAARSVRVALVIGSERGDVRQERGKGVVRDLDHAAAFFPDVAQHLESIGVIVTSDVATLMQLDPAPMILERLKDAFEDLAEHAVPAVGRAGLSMDGVGITRAGLTLLQHLCEQSRKACAMLEEVKEGDDTAVLARLCEECAVFPANVLRGDQRNFLWRHLDKLKPVRLTRSGRADGVMVYRLPSESANDLARAMDSELAAARNLIDRRGVNWAADQDLKSSLFSLFHLFTVLEAKPFLPYVHDMKQDLCQQLLCQNGKAAADLLEGAAFGNVSKLECALEALVAMDGFRKELLKQLPDLKLQGWSSSRAAMKEGAARAQQELAQRFPAELIDVKWDTCFASEVCGIFAAAEKLEDSGSAVLSEWAGKLLEHARGLKSKAAECTDAGSVVRALTRLQEHQEHLPDLFKLLGKHCCQPSAAEGLGALFDEAKAAVREQLGVLSRRTVEELRKSKSPAGSSEPLKQLCGSTELNAILDEDLVYTYILKPLSCVLVPTQDEVDDVCKMMQASSPLDQWCTHLSCLTQRVQDAGEFGPQMLTYGILDFAQLLDIIQKEVADAQTLVQQAVRQLASVSQSHRPYASVAASMVSGMSGQCEVDNEVWDGHELAEEAELALTRLKVLLPADWLLRRFGRSDAHTAAMALQSLGWTLRPGAANLGEGLGELVGGASVLLQEFVQKEIDEWAKASTDMKGWPDVFNHHIQQVDKLQHLSQEVGQAASKLVQTVSEWRQSCLSKARDASEHAESWQDFIEHAVRQGMEFEESALFHSLNYHNEEFRLLVEVQAERWQKELLVAAHTAKRDVGQKLRTLTASLERLPGFARKETGLVVAQFNIQWFEGCNNVSHNRVGGPLQPRLLHGVA